MKKRDKGALFLLFLIGLGLLIAYFLSGQNVALFNPKGFIANEQRNLLVFSIGFMLLAVIPAVLLTFFTAWKYRDSNKIAARDPDASHSKWFVLTIWMIPTVFMIVLGIVMWEATHSLEPQKKIQANEKTMTIQVVALRWKWLFIYPEQNIATVNFVQVPVDTPVEFQLTADDSPMSAFWVPNLGGMLYAMTGHVNRLNLMAETPGDYPGQSAEINGEGFSGMKFTARAGTQKEFDEWVKTAKNSQSILDESAYANLLIPSENNQVAYYSHTTNDLYSSIVMKYMHHGEEQSENPTPVPAEHNQHYH